MTDNLKVHCINLDSRKDKWERVQVEAEKIGWDPIRFPAIKKPYGHDGCRLSHLTLLRELRDLGEFIIMEDDMKICDLYDTPTNIIESAYSQLPDDWDMFYLGATLNIPLERFSPNLYRVKKAWATHAVFYNNQNGVVDYILENHNTRKFSVFLCDDVQFKFNCYITYPMVATQQAGHSDILRHYVDYKVIEQRYKKYVG